MSISKLDFLMVFKNALAGGKHIGLGDMNIVSTTFLNDVIISLYSMQTQNFCLQAILLRNSQLSKENKNI